MMNLTTVAVNACSDSKTKVSFEVLPFLLRTPLKRGHKLAKLSPSAVLRQMWVEFEVKYCVCCVLLDENQFSPLN
jgi:hypothetical protein